VSAFAFAAYAQDQPTKQKDADAKGVKEMRHDGMGRGERGMRGDRRGPGGPGFELRGLNLTDAQKEQIKQIYEANKPSQALMDEMRTLHEAHRAGTLTVDQQARMKALRDEGRQKAESVHAQVLAVLTAEQKAQLEQRRQEMRQRMEERRKEMQDRQQQRQTDKQKSTTTTTDTTKVN
jgi:Spy/CpxP family protein refolding chaperone